MYQNQTKMRSLLIASHEHLLRYQQAEAGQIAKVIIQICMYMYICIYTYAYVYRWITPTMCIYRCIYIYR